LSDHGEQKVRAGVYAIRRFEQSPRVCHYGCPGLCLTKCVQAGECIVFDTPATVDLNAREWYAIQPVELSAAERDEAVKRLARVLNTIHLLCATADDTYDLAGLLVSRGVRALAP
jgi:hypothetical protein